MKKIIIISAIIGIIALGIGVYFGWKKSRMPEDGGILSLLSPSESPQAASSAAKSPKIKILTKNEVLDYWIFDSIVSATSSTSTQKEFSKKIFYVSSRGKIFKLTESGEEIVGDVPMGSFQGIVFSGDGNFIAVKSEISNLRQIDIYDVSKNLWQPSITNVYSADFSPDSKKLAYFQSAGSKGFDLMVKNLVNSKDKVQKIISLNIADADISWIQTDHIILSPKPSFEVLSEIILVNVKTGIVSRLASENGLWINWSKFGIGGLGFYASNGRNYNFGFFEISGNKRGSFNFKTMPDKCFIASVNQIYCAIPKNQDVFGVYVFPDDYFKRKISFNDAIYLINMNDNKFQILYSSDEQNIEAANLKVMDDQMLFINKYDKKLYGLEIK